MPLLRSLFLGCWLLASVASAAPWSGLPWSGDLRGELNLPAQTPVAWTVRFAESSGPVRTGTLQLRGPGLAAEVALTWDEATNLMTWTLPPAAIEPGAWLATLAAWLGWDELSSITVSDGTMTFQAAGRWSGGALTGEFTVDASGLTVADPGRGMELRDVALRVSGPLEAVGRGAVPFSLTIGTITTGRFGARALSLRGALRGIEAVEVSALEVEMAGGVVKADGPFAVRLDPLAVAARVRFSRVGLQDLVQFVPDALSQAQGRVSGEMGLAWSEGRGFELGAGRIALDASEPTTVHLRSSPGFLSAQVPARFELLPAWLGPVARWFAPVNPAHATLVEVETGRLALRVESLQVRLTPEGDARGRTASVTLKGYPGDGRGTVREVTFDVNVSGPLSEVLRIGIEQDVSLSVR